jgi:hypothetical protein
MLKRRMVSVAVVLLALVAMPAAAGGQPDIVFDNFDVVQIKQPDNTGDDPYWWIIQNGGEQQYYATEKVGKTTFARLRLFHDTTPGDYVSSEISEMRTGYSYGLPARWLPVVGHPVVAVARVRFSPNYHQDGSGGAVGSAGFWLWNSYVDLVTQTMHPVTSLGFSWAEQGSVGGYSGLGMSVVQDTYPVYVQPVTRTVRMNDWMLWTMVWSVDSAGAQSVRYWIDGHLVGETTLDSPLPALSITLWNDNQYPTILEDGSLTVAYHNPSNQRFDIDMVAVARP